MGCQLQGGPDEPADRFESNGSATVLLVARDGLRSSYRGFLARPDLLADGWAAHSSVSRREDRERQLWPEAAVQHDDPQSRAPHADLVAPWIEGTLVVLILVAVWFRHRSKLTVTRALAAAGAFWLLSLAAAMVVSPWCTWSEKLVQRKVHYANFFGGLCMLGYGYHTLRHAFSRGSHVEDAASMESHETPPPWQ